MSVDPNFQAASQAAESWLNTVFCVVHLAESGKSGDVETAYQLLMPTKGLRYNLLNDYNEHARILDSMKDQLATVSDGSVEWEHGRGLSAVVRVPSATYPHVWSSAHEAAAGITQLALVLLVSPLEGITDAPEQHKEAKRLLAAKCKALTMPLVEVARLQEHIRRERAKLIVQQSPVEDQPAKLPTIWYHGEQSYSQDRQHPVKVSHEMHNVLQAFLDRTVAQDTKDLNNSGVSNVTTVMDKLIKKFPQGAIRRPNDKGDGYFIRVRSLKSS